MNIEELEELFFEEKSIEQNHYILSVKDLKRGDYFMFHPQEEPDNRFLDFYRNKKYCVIGAFSALTTQVCDDFGNILYFDKNRKVVLC